MQSCGPPGMEFEINDIGSLKNRHLFYKHCEEFAYVSAQNLSKLYHSPVCEC